MKSNIIIGGTSMQKGYAFIGKKGIDKIIELSAEYPQFEFIVREDNYNYNFPTVKVKNRRIETIEFMGNKAISVSKLKQVKGITSTILQVTVK